MPFLAAHPSLLRALSERGYHEPTAVQSAVLGVEAYQRDLLVSAQTGSGKTVAFGLAMAPTLLGENEKFGPARAPAALIVAPTRELALQVQRELAWLYSKTGARITTCVGGMDIRREAQNLAGGVHIVAGTPGRLRDHLDSGRLDLSQLRVVVLDEADEMLDMGFREEIEHILATSPKDRRTLLFSATFPPEIASLTKKYQRDAVRLATHRETDAHRDIEYRACVVAPRDKERAVVNILRHEEVPGALVFCATREGVTRLSASLSERGFACVALSGDLSQRERTTALQALRDGRAKVCVATDVAARGLDLPDLGLVVHADLPQNKEVLTHRSGRTGRAGKKGIAVMVVPAPARRSAERLLRMGHIDASWGPPPSAAAIHALDQERLISRLGPLFEDVTDEDRVLGEKLLGQRSAVDLAAVLLRVERAQLPAAEEMAPIDERGRGRTGGRDDVRGGRSGRDDHDPRGGRFGARDARDERPSRFGARSERPAGRGESAGRGEPAGRGPRGDSPRAEPRRSRESEAPARAGHPRVDGGESANNGVESPAPRRRDEGGSSAPGSQWFSLKIGKMSGADPKWLIPFLCRRGDVRKNDIGAIRVMARETQVEILAGAKDRFTAGVAKPLPANDKDRRIIIKPM